MKSVSIVGLLIVMIAGGGAGAIIALKMQGGDAEPEQEPDVGVAVPKPIPDPRRRRRPDKKPRKGPAKKEPEKPRELIKITVPGHYTAKLRAAGIDIDFMTPTLLTPLSKENIPSHCPERLAVVTGDDSHQKTIQPVLDALGSISLPKPEAGALATQAVLHINQQAAAFKALAGGPMSTPPLRILYKHYPRDDLKGHCVTLQLTIFNVPDSFFDKEWFQKTMRNRRRDGKPVEIRGQLLEVRKTYQLEGGAPRLIEACIEAHPHVGVGVRRHAVGRVVGEGKTHKLLEDGEQTAHFMMYGGGDRWGVVWLDRSLGLAEKDPWTRAYHVNGISMKEGTKVEMAELPAAIVPVLLEVVERS